MANEKILVVDDDTNICELLRLYLTKEGYQVTTANDGEEGLEKFNQLKPDMVLLDVMMPRMDGLEVCRRIRKLGNTPVMMLTAKGETFDKVLGLELGADDYMVKPFEPRYLMCHILSLTGRKTAPAENLPSDLRKSPCRQNVDERLGSLFLTMGIPAHIKGYQFLRQAVKMVVADPDVINRITKELYPGIARYFGTSASKVERAIRHAIEVAWNRGRVETLNTAFGCRVCTPEDKPTNGEFIAMIADKLSMERSA